MQGGESQFGSGPGSFDPNNPYRPAAHGPGGPQHRRSSAGIIIAIVAGIGLVGVLVCCGLCGGLGYFGMNVFSEQVANELRDNPILREHIGEIQSFTLNFTATAAHDSEDVFVFDVQGSKGQGVVTAESQTIPDDSEAVISATLRLPTGEVIDLLPEN